MHDDHKVLLLNLVLAKQKEEHHRKVGQGAHSNIDKGGERATKR